MKVNERASSASVMSSTRSLARPSCRQHVRSHVRSHVHHVVNTFAGTSVPHSYPPLSNLSKTIINETLKKANPCISNTQHCRHLHRPDRQQQLTPPTNTSRTFTSLSKFKDTPQPKNTYPSPVGPAGMTSEQGPRFMSRHWRRVPECIGRHFQQGQIHLW